MAGSTATAYKSPLHEMTQTTPTCLWNDSASIEELTYSIEHGAVGATCNPVIVLGVLKKEMNLWKDRIHGLIKERPTATEDEIAWQLVREVSIRGAALSTASISTGSSLPGVIRQRTDASRRSSASLHHASTCAVISRRKAASSCFGSASSRSNSSSSTTTE